ncbi:C39 family peptidase [Ectopseudomonas mendocina]|jgi:predicted double-glycine peptidase|uniref:Peptidase C39, bacteriocin processing n=2 Tax=Ectopseudomonas mendocina TaxID=300 RepID=A0A379IUF7_ECTME|nr:MULTISPECIES: C39 family peptidase [Pseudomonas]AEB58679.1 peptidase C39, bacteriocin processing [Pseudomonas mendocina NK-01]ALN19170.1 peptidase C39 [Pseudomonas mendocina S5.2]KER99961.1 peptidase C39 [Pseudomonas mendocina]MDF2074534.1 C39 family peptidase [Pseudomonas mendocina]QTN45516.1 peptidase C39 [Pseudomonas mendocina]
MIEILVGSLIGLYGFTEAVDIKPQPTGTVNITQPLVPNGPLRESVVLEPMSQLQFRNVIRQAYDYSCGSAALTTLLDYFLGRNLEERQVMEGLLHFGEAEKIVERRGFSLLDMKRFVTALGYKSGGFRAGFDDLAQLEHPAIVPIEYAGFKHFVVVRDVYNEHVFVADPALGNISFTRVRFEEIWDQNVLFVIFPSGNEPPNAMELTDRDLRIIDDRTISMLAFREFPQMAKFTTNQADQLGSGGDIQYIRRK